MNKDDWRLRGQEDYLIGKTRFKATAGHSAHEHCDFCWHMFMESCEGLKDCSTEGYCTEDKKYWICEKCFDDIENSNGM
jgi:hypothetical protein